MSYVSCGFSRIKIHFSDYQKSLISRINEVYVFFWSPKKFHSFMTVCFAAITLVIVWHGFCDVSVMLCNVRYTTEIFCNLSFLAHLSRRLIGELKVYQWLRRPDVVRQHFQTSSPLKLQGQLKSYFIWRLLRMRERKFVQMVLVTWPRWHPRPYMVKNPQKSSSPEPEGRWPWDLVCSIGVVGPTKFVQMVILGWPWPT